MNPETIQRLKQSPDFNEVVLYLRTEHARLDSLSEMGLGESFTLTMSPDRIAVEVLANAKSAKKLATILLPLLEPVDKPPSPDPREFVV